MPVSALTRAGVVRVMSGSYTAAMGTIVGPPAPVFERAASSVMPKNPVSSAPEYVVGTATCGIVG